MKPKPAKGQVWRCESIQNEQSEHGELHIVLDTSAYTVTTWGAAKHSFHGPVTLFQQQFNFTGATQKK